MFWLWLWREFLISYWQSNANYMLIDRKLCSFNQKIALAKIYTDIVYTFVSVIYL